MHSDSSFHDEDSYTTSQRINRLKSLIERSKIYTSILAEKLLKQQMQQRAQGEAKDKQTIADLKTRKHKIPIINDSANNEKTKEITTVNKTTTTTTPTPTTRRLTRKAAAAVEGGESEEKLVPMVNSKENLCDTSKREKSVGNNKKRKPNKMGPLHASYQISDYFSLERSSETKSVSQALHDAQKECNDKTNMNGGNDPVDGINSITKPSASARQPDEVTGCVLRDYQLAGLEWLVSLYENGLNGILADEMGLGKTVQTIAFLAFLRSKGTYGPFLIVAPLSTLANWIQEIQTFTPNVPCVLYHGTKEERAKIRSERLSLVDRNFPIVVTSYEMIMNDRVYLANYRWKFIVIDEGHRLKNLNCKLIRELKSYDSANRLLLTGTPLQNNLRELWSLLNFILPEIFDDADEFERWFDFSSLTEERGESGDGNGNGNGNGSEKILDEEQKNNLVSNLHLILKPFLLRRLKIDVEHDLPKKREYTLYAPLTNLQSKLTQAIINKNLHEFLAHGENTVDLEDEENSTKQSFQNTKVSEDLLTPPPPPPPLSSTTSGNKSLRSKIRKSYRETTDSEWFREIEANALKTENKSDSSDNYLPITPPRSKSSSPATGGLRLQNTVMQLRKAANHPYLFHWPTTVINNKSSTVPKVDGDIIKISGKMILLNQLLLALFERGHKVLVFSQFTTMLDIIEEYATVLMKWKVYRIDGAVKQLDRQQQLKEFNSNRDAKLFLLSTRAGGLGINLTAADTVIIFDSDWNPQQDLQAQDRAHRIGQKNPVIVYRFVTENSVESKILEKAAVKRRLEKLVIQNGKFKSLLSNGTDQEILREISATVFNDDSEKVLATGESHGILSDMDLERLLDRRYVQS